MIFFFFLKEREEFCNVFLIETLTVKELNKNFHLDVLTWCNFHD